MVKEIYKERIKVLTELWGKIIDEQKDINREEVIIMIEQAYKDKHIKPIRGFRAENLYEKELISLYVVGKDGLGLYEQYPTIFENILSQEVILDKSASLLLEGKPLEAFEFLQRNKENLAKALRLIFIEGIFSFKPEEQLYKALRDMDATNVDEVKHTAISFARFYTAYKIAEGIAEKSIRDKMSIEAMKKALSISIGIKYPLPKPEYIALIAEKVFGVNPKLLKKIMG